MHGVIYISIFICTCMCLYTIMLCTDGVTIDMCLCVLLAAIGMVHYWMNVSCSVVCVYCLPM